MTPADVLPTFLRPLWLLGLLALPLLAWGWQRRARRRNVWRENVDPHLLAHLLAPAPARSQAGLWMLLAGAALALLAMAGPSWREQPQPLWQTHTPLVIALELSESMQATDLQPSRLLQARALIAELLAQRADGQVGLVVYAADAHTVSPLTDDPANVALFLDALTPAIMPVDGTAPARGIAWAQRLLQQAGYSRGDILMIGHRADAQATRAAALAAAAGFRVSALGLGSATGAMVRDENGTVQHTQLDAASLRAVAASGNGQYAEAGLGRDPLAALDVLEPDRSHDATTQGERRSVPLDQGYWLLPPVLLLAVFAFRRGASFAAWGVIALLALPMAAPPAQAAERSLWKRADQQAYDLASQGDAAYRQGDYAAAAQAYGRLSGADAAYNQGNALAKQGQYPEAIAAYDRALRMQPGMADAIANRQAVQAAMQRPPPQGGQQPPRQDPRDGQAQGQSSGDGGQSSDAQPPSPANPDPQDGQEASSRRQAQPASGSSSPETTTPADLQAQQQADAAQRQAMEKALAGQEPSSGQQAQAAMTPEQRERALATEAALRRVPDDPGALLRAKFRLEHERRRAEGE